jgi:replicative DNA helicase
MTAPPKDVSTERALLGSIMLRPASLHEARDILEPTDFWDERHRWIFGAMIDTGGANIIELDRSIRAVDAKRRISSYISGLSIADGSMMANTRRFAVTLQRYSAARNILGVCHEITDRVHQIGLDAASVEPVVHWAHAQLGAAVSPLLRTSGANRGCEKLSDLYYRIGEALSAQHATKPPPSVITTTFPRLDERVEFVRGAVNVIAARPGVGKSSFADQLLTEYARLGYRPHQFRLEDQNEHHAIRCLSHRSGIDARQIRRLVDGGATTDAERKQAAELCSIIVNDLGTLEGTIDETPGLTVEQIRMKARELSRAGTSVFIIDHGLRVKRPRKIRETRDKVSHVIRELGEMAKELGAVVICLTQLNRDAAHPDRWPTLRDLKETGTWEEDARVVLMLHRPRWDTPTAEGAKPAWIIVEKANHDEAGVDVPFVFVGRRCLWRAPRDEHAEDVMIEATQRTAKRGRERVVIGGPM